MNIADNHGDGCITMKNTKLFLGMLLLFGSTVTQAVTINLVGNEDANNTATAQITYDSVNTLTVVLTNTSQNSELITGFAFNAPDAVTGISAFTASGTLDDDEWSSVFDPNGVSTPQPLGFFDVGAITGNNLEGGDPQEAITTLPPTNIGTFTFTFAGNGLDLAGLTVASFLNLVSQPSGNGNQGANADFQTFAVRFQQTGVNGGGSDVAIPQVPLPAAAWLFLSGLAGLFGVKRLNRA